MIDSRLPRRVVLRHLDRLGHDLAPRQLDRLRKLAELIDDGGRIPLVHALEVATPGGDARTAQAAFRKFRAAVQEATAAAGVKLRLVTDGRKTTPEGRWCWFEGQDTADAELAEMSAREAQRTTDDVLVPPTVTEVFDVTIYVSTACGDLAPWVRSRDEEVVRLLREGLALRRDHRYQVISPFDIGLGREVAADRARLRDQADVVLVLVSRALLLDSGGDWPAGEATARRRPVLVALERLPPGQVNAPGLPLAEMHQQSRPFDERRSRSEKMGFVDECLVAVAGRLAEPVRPTIVRHGVSAAVDGPDLSRWMRDELCRKRQQVGLVRSHVQETDFAERSVLVSDAVVSDAGASLRGVGRRVAAVERLVTWATDSAETAPALCALLGDVGMGKTTTTKLLTEELLDRRDRDPGGLLPILFDLRELPSDVFRGGPNLRRIVEALLDASDVQDRRPSADEVLDLVAHGNCVLIFDGLDEVLVRLDPHQGQNFTRTLWRATEGTWQTSRVAQPGRPRSRPDRPSKLLLSCRTHYFRSIRDETTHFTGQHRDGPAASNYLALLMLPFDEGQIRDYLRANLPGADVDRLLDLIDSVHNLREIAERPLTLRMITEQLELIERAKLVGRPVRAVDLYASFVEQWLARDQGKHSLLPDHKQLLMEHLAAQLWRSGAGSWTVDDVEQWLLEFMASRPDLELHYPARDPDLWKEDLRTATFLIRRDDDTFAFAHTSLREYFLARYLHRAVELGAERPESARQAWSMSVPSRETLKFLGQLLAGLDARRTELCRRSLTALAGSSTELSAAILAFAYGLVAAAGGYPHHPLSASRLDGADLRGWRMEAPGGSRLNLRGASFIGADLTGAVLREVDLRGADLTRADLTRAELHNSDLRATTLQQTQLTGTVLRSCNLDGARWSGSTAHRAQSLHCHPAGEPTRPGWFTAPIGKPVALDARLVSLSGHTGSVWGGGFSPDGTRILTTSDDGTGRVWDAGSGEVLLTLSGHTGSVWGGGFSPDGTRILTTCADGTGRL
ncbi:MAG: NACHT and WD40 repeat domain-containing protein, partial [Pseudonocardiaceae bacterium]